MLGSLVSLALRQRLLVVLATLALVGWGVDAYRRLPIDAFPDVSPTQVLVAMQAPGLPPEELEAQVTNPVELAMKGIPNLVNIRSVTRYATALMTFEFGPGTDIYWARTQVDQRLDDLESQFPDGVSGGLAPVVTPLGEMLMFTLTGGNLTPMQRRTIMDWTIRPQLRGLPGVADMNTLGGHVRTYEVAPDPAAMAARGITTAMLADALGENNRNDGAGRVRDGEEALLVRVEGRIRTLEDIRAIVVVAHPTGVVRVSDVADVRFGALARNGVVTRNGDGEAVWGIVLGLRGANARTVVNGATARLAEIQKTLPEGVRIEVFYDRNDLIEKAVWTVQKVLLEAIALVVVLLILFLGNLRAALVVSLSLPLAVLATFGIMRLTGISANIMSLGGLAIAIGLLVDCAVVVVENVAHRLGEMQGRTDYRARMQVTLEAVREVAVPLISGVVIIVTVFLPLLSLQGLEGRLFGPVALTIIFALAAALLLSLTVVPALAASLLAAGGHAREPWLVRRLHGLYDPFLRWAMANPLKVGGTALAGLVLAGLLFTRIGSTFMPVMDEGTPVITLRKHPTISVEEAAASDLRLQEAILEAVPEVRGIMGRAGADELGIDPVGLNDSDLFLTVAPRAEWRDRRDPDFVMAQLRGVLDAFPGISYAINQPIDMRVQEMIIGARGDVVVKVFGFGIPELNRIAREVEAAITGITGASEVFALRNEGMKYLRVEPDRFAIGRLGLQLRDVQQALRVWVDGRQAGIVLEQERRIPLMLRGEGSVRRSASDLERLILALPGGRTVALYQVARITEEEGAIQVIREATQRYATVLSNVRGRDLVGFVAEAQAAVAAKVQLPEGYRLEWGGQFENQQRASGRLAVVVPIALGLIFLLLYFTFGSLRQAALVFCNVPFAAIGGVIALWASGEFLSVPASVGFIALIGIAVLNGVVLVSTINRLNAEEGLVLRDAVLEGARRRMTPVVLTATIAAFGLVPFLFADGPGAEIQRPLAIVVIGGLLTATVLTLVLLPILYARFALPPEEAQRAPKAAAAAALALALLLAPWPALAQSPGLARHLEQAMALDAEAQALAAQRGAVAARRATVNSPIAGSPVLGGSWRADTRGPNRAREWEMDAAAPMWLPGQRTALGGTVDAAVLEAERRLAARRLVVAGVLRETWWNAVLAAREERLARDRLVTARDIARDVARRASYGDVPQSDVLLGRNETLAAELALAQAAAEQVAARNAYRVLTGGAEPELPVEPMAERPPRHPALLAAEASLAAAEAEARLVAATPRDNPELGLFGRGQDGVVTEQGVSVSVRLRVPLATEARNRPRQAAAEAGITRAAAELAQRRRLVAAEIARAEASLRAAEVAAQWARQRLAVADQQLDVARRAFRSGDTGLFELYRVRQLWLEATGAEARLAVELGRARSRLNQALGVI